MNETMITKVVSNTQTRKMPLAVREARVPVLANIHMCYSNAGYTKKTANSYSNKSD